MADNQQEHTLSEGASGTQPVAVDLSGDGGVLKTIIHPGNGWEKPNNGIDVGVHYTGTLTTGEVFDSSVSRKELFHFKLGAGNVIRGWDITVASMTRGEKCKVVLAPNYAYGEGGSGSIPPNATLIFEIELIEFDNEIDISPGKSGGIRYLSTKAGTGSKPAYDASVTVNYTIKSLPSGNVLADGRSQTFCIGDETFPYGVELAIQELTLGAAGKFKIDPAFAYPEGNPSLGIPENTSTEWEIEITDLTNIPDAYSLEAPERIKIASEKKVDGNALFGQGKFQRALDKYELAITFTNYIGGDQATEAEELGNTCKLNAAMCQLRLGHFGAAKEHCSKVLTGHPNNVKALYRRALAYEGLNQLDDAATDLKKLISVDSTNVDGARLLAKIGVKIKAVQEKERTFCARMFQ